MDPWIDVLGWALVCGCLIALRYEIPRSVREIRKILRESQELQRHIDKSSVRVKE